ncbi:MAG: STM4015 family protein [Pseudomonadota bacterium]
MTINEENETQFYGLPVVDFNPQLGIENPTTQVYRLAYDYEQETKFKDILEKFLNDPRITDVPAIIIGHWEDAYEVSPDYVLQQLIEQRDKLPKLKALFVGDMTSEECEISWIQQTDYAPLLKAFPLLEQLRVRGSNDLQFSQLRLYSLKTLIIETGGLPCSVIESVINAKLPALEHLELWLGTDEYGFDGDLNTIKPLLEMGAFPKLRYLGLRDSEIADDIAIEIAKSPLPKQLEILDLSMGTLTDNGAQALLNSEYIKSLKKLDLDFHFMSTTMMEKLENLGIDVDVSDQQEEDEDGDRYVAVSE